MDDDDLIMQLFAIEELEQRELYGEVTRRTYEPIDPFEHLTDRQFISLYRLSKDLCRRVVDMVRPFMVAPSRRSALTIERKVFTALRFFAAGSYQQEVGANRHTSISQCSVSRILEEVTSALCEPAIFDKYVCFPKNINELLSVREEFFNKFRFPGVIGAIDCTHIAIGPPRTEDQLYPEHIYVNRKGYHSINTQLICDANLRIMNVSARFSGSKHDAHIWNQSKIKQLMSDLHENGYKSYFLVGDSGYALRPWVLTPFLNPAPNSPEALFNESFCKVRSIIERCNGVLKMRFRCLLKHRVLHYLPNKASKIIKSCIVLHNLCIMENVPLIDSTEINSNDFDFGIFQLPVDPDANNAQRQNNRDLIAGRLVRQKIVQTMFT